MALLIQLKRNNDSSVEKAYGRWFGRVKYTGTVTLPELSRTMQQNCTVKRSDIMAVLIELVETMRTEMQLGHKVQIDGLGTFMFGISSDGVAYAQDWTPERHVRDIHVVFIPERHRCKDGTFRHTLTEGTDLKALNVLKSRKRFPKR